MGRKRRAAPERWADSRMGWIHPSEAMPPTDKHFKAFGWSVNVELLLNNGEIVRAAYYRPSARMWGVNESLKDIHPNDVQGWRHIL